MEGADLRYAVVTPVRDEAENLRRLSTCLAEQSLPPSRWILVDTGSTDGTPDLVRELAARYPWIDLVTQADSHATERGGPIVRAFETGVTYLDPLPDVV